MIAYEINPNPEVLAAIIFAGYEAVQGFRSVALANQADVENSTAIGALTTMLGGFAF